MPHLHADPFDALPAWLPPGRLIEPDADFADGTQAGAVLWVSDEPVPDAARHWLRLFGSREETGLYPLLLETLHGDPGRPWHDGELGAPHTAGSIDVLAPNGVLRRFWESVTEELPEDADDDDLVDKNGVPRGPWPGLAPAAAPRHDPDEAAGRYVEARYTGRELLLGLVPAARGADTPALVGWMGPCNHTDSAQEISAVLRSWEDRFGARVVSVGFATLDLSVAAPPTTADHAVRVAAEHHAFCPDNVWQGCGDFTEYATGLVGEDGWSFWWD